MESFARLYVGMSYTLQKKITIDDTALNYGSGKVQELFATPRLIAFMIEASAQLIDPTLPDGFVSVGNQVSVDHFKPTLQGATVTIEVKITGFEEGRYIFEMIAYDEFGQIGNGRHARSIVNYSSLLDKAHARQYGNYMAG